MSKRRHNFRTKRFKVKSLFIFYARIALKSLILLFVRLIARGARIGKTHRHTRGGVEGPAGTANAAPLFTVVRIAVPLFKAGRTGAANVPPRMRDCSARAYSTYAWASTVKLLVEMQSIVGRALAMRG